MSANTVLHNVIVIGQLFRRHGRLNITKEVELPQRITSLPKEYTEEQRVRFFAVCTPTEKALFTTFVTTGLREQEIVHLTWSDGNLPLRTIESPLTAQRNPPGREWLRVRLEPARNDCHAVDRTWDYARNARVGQVAIVVYMEDRQMRGPARAINCGDQT